MRRLLERLPDLLPPSGLAPASRPRLRMVPGLLLLCLALVLLGLGLRARASLTPTPIYSVAALEANLARDPSAWLHRTVRVRATLGGQCTAMAGLYTTLSCSDWRLALTDPQFPNGQSADGSVQALPLAWERPPAWLTTLRHLPLLRSVLAPSQVLHSGVAAVYRVELRPTACLPWQASLCDEALLLDALPPDDSFDWVRIGS